MTLLDIIEIYNMKTGRKIDDIGSLYEDIDIDARLDKDVLVGSLLDECGAMNCLYDTTATFKYFSNNFFKKYKWNIEKLLDTLELKYDPLTNKNIQWTETTKIDQDLDTAESQSQNLGRSTSESENEKNTGSVRNTGTVKNTGTVRNEDEDNEENKISAMKSSSYQPDNNRDTDGSSRRQDDLQREDNLKREDDLRKDRSNSFTEHTNTNKDRNKSENLAWDETDTHTEIGVNNISYQELIEKERKVAQFSIYNWIAKKYAKELFLLVY